MEYKVKNSKVIRLSESTLAAIYSYKCDVIDRLSDDLAKKCMENMSLDDFIRHCFEDMKENLT